MARNLKLKIEDESGDRKYFTIVPNFILNHSTAIDQALYLQMKRYAGEKGKCFASEKTLINQLGIGRNALKKSLKYLIEHNWIEVVGKKPVSTRGGMQNINVYSVVDLWELNINHYKGVSETVPLESKGVSETTSGGVQNDLKGVSRTATEEEPVEEEPIKKNTLTKVKAESASYGNEEINNLTEYLKSIIGGSLDGTQRENRNYAHLLLERFRRDYPNRNPVELIKLMVDRGSADRFHAKNITGFKYLYYNAMKIIQSAKSDLNKNHITKIS